MKSPKPIKFMLFLSVLSGVLSIATSSRAAECQHRLKAEFADFPVGEDVFYEINADENANVPESAGGGKGVYVESNNHSDNLFMYVKREICGLKPFSQYQVQVSTTLATNATSDFGIGGSPVTSVYVKAGATTCEPRRRMKWQNKRLYWVADFDKGEQWQSGKDLMTLGDLSREGDDAWSSDFTAIRRTMTPQYLTVTANAAGKIWLATGADSGFEGFTGLYFQALEANLKEVGPSNQIEYALRATQVALAKMGAHNLVANLKELRGLLSNSSPSTQKIIDLIDQIDSELHQLWVTTPSDPHWQQIRWFWGQVSQPNC